MTRSITIIALAMAATATATYHTSWDLLQSPYLFLIHGNLNRYSLSSKQNMPIESPLCTAYPVYIDYSIDDDCYVIVCNDIQEARIRVVSMKEARSKEKRFKADNLLLRRVREPDNIWVAFDWIHGLLYFTEDRIIFIVDLKQESPEEIEIYTANSTITGLVVRPDLSTLVWIEHKKQLLDTRIMQSTQNGKDVTELYYKKYVYMENLEFDYISKQYMAIARPEKELRFGWIFGNDFRSEMPFEVKIPSFRGNKVILYDHYLIFDVLKINDTTEWYISFWDTHNGYNISTSQKLYEPRDHSFLGAITLMSEIPRGGDIENHCQGHLCKHEHDFCVPTSARTYICMSNPNHVYIIESYLSRSKWLQFLLMTFIMLLLTVLVIFIIIFTKKKVRFYQIRLKSINRVNSARLEVKTPAKNEIAE